MEKEDSIAIDIIKSRIEGLKATIEKYTGEENIGVRIHAQGKIGMLNEIIEAIEITIERLK